MSRFWSNQSASSSSSSSSSASSSSSSNSQSSSSSDSDSDSDISVGDSQRPVTRHPIYLPSLPRSDTQMSSQRSIPSVDYSLISDEVQQQVNQVLGILGTLNNDNDRQWESARSKDMQTIAIPFLNKWYSECITNRNPLLLQFLSDRLVSTIFRVTRIMHSEYSLDRACLSLLSLMVKTEEGYRFMILHRDIIMTRWNNGICQGFAQASKPLVDNFIQMERIMNQRLEQERLEERSREQKKRLELEKRSAMSEAQKEALLEVITAENGTPLFAAHCLEEYNLSNTSNMGILLAPLTFSSSAPCTPALLRKRLKALPMLHRKSPAAFRNLFSEGCVGCIALNLICCAEMLHTAQFAYLKPSASINHHKGDKSGSYLAVLKVLNLLQKQHNPTAIPTSLDELLLLCQESRCRYRRRDDPYPYMGNCIDFGGHGPFIDKMEALGRTIV